MVASDQLNMTSDQFEKGDDQNWSQNQLVIAGHGWSWPELVTNATRPEFYYFKLSGLHYSCPLPEYRYKYGFLTGTYLSYSGE